MLGNKACSLWKSAEKVPTWITMHKLRDWEISSDSPYSIGDVGIQTEQFAISQKKVKKWYPNAGSTTRLLQFYKPHCLGRKRTCSWQHCSRVTPKEESHARGISMEHWLIHWLGKIRGAGDILEKWSWHQRLPPHVSAKLMREGIIMTQNLISIS